MGKSEKAWLCSIVGFAALSLLMIPASILANQVSPYKEIGLVSSIVFALLVFIGIAIDIIRQ